jgi:hypothetical protein
MTNFTRTLAVAGLLGVGFWFSVRAGDESKIEKTATDLVEQFLKSYRAKSIDEILKHVDVPWLDTGGRIVKELKQLKQSLLQSMKRPGAIPPDWKVLKVLRYFELRREFGTACELLDPVVPDASKVVIVGSEEPLVLRYVLVRLKGGTPKIVGGPYPLTYLLKPNKMPARAQAALEKSQNVELFSLDPSLPRKQTKESFHDWAVLGKTTLNTEAGRKRLRTAFERAVRESSGAVAACFNPRHGIRVSYEKGTIDFIICFECLLVQIIEGDNYLPDVLVSDSGQIVFDGILRDAGIPLAKKKNK